MAKLYFRYGAMNSGKSTALMQVAHNYKERGMHAIIVKPQIDTKGGDRVVSRLGVERKVDLLLPADKNVYDEITEYIKGKKISCVLVDEVQFFKKHQIDQFFEIATRMDVPVICYGLRTDFMTNGFEGSERLLLLAHEIEELKTICRCGKKAILNGRLIDGQFVFSGSQVAIDGENHVDYESLCAECYFKYLDIEENNG